MAQTCSRCRHALLQDWSAPFYSKGKGRSNRDYLDRHFVAYINHIKSFNKCDACRFLYSMRWGDDPAGCYLLYAFSLRHLLPDGNMYNLYDDLLVLGVVPENLSQGLDAHGAVRLSRNTGFVASSTIGTKARRIGVRTIDYDMLRRWSNLSDDGFIEELNPDSLTPEKLPLHLIEVHSRSIVVQPHWEQDFVALSYVWGNIKGNPDRIGDTHSQLALPEKCPQTIEDAITVTKHLGLRYLWVDLYCISRNQETRHAQIARMDAIYKTARLTLIATGDDAFQGLPGISRDRISQPVLSMDDYSLVGLRIDALYELETSKYSTRAWTYQERIFSQRSIVFTEHQVFLEAKDQVHIESLSVPLQWKTKAYSGGRHLQLDLRSIEKRISFKIDGTSEVVSPSSRFTYTTWLHLFQHHVIQYTKRNLTYDSDSINAIQAVLDSLDREDSRISSVWGIPHRVVSFKSELDQTLGFGLSWTFTDIHKLPRRRSGFPSWSWAGWEGAICWIEVDDWNDITGYYAVDDRIKRHPPLCPCTNGMKKRAAWSTSFRFLSAEVEATRAQVETWAQLFTDYSFIKLSTLPLYLMEIAADCLVLKFECIDNVAHFLWDERKSMRPRHSRLHVSQLRMSNTIHKMSTGRLLGVKLGEKHKAGSVWTPGTSGDDGHGVSLCEIHLLVITEPKNKADWGERVGIIKVPFEWYSQQQFERKKFLLG
ncbi:heterokaryon incompatibility protein-domain-containing protein [Lophiotrema nucula]|uniref:Heterokaryon incompatibility protein-domain-containing protein n=1 Tax=Lophiotrema nucula TaxID=690887 RepID=A0A6A5ZN92_9PLEO|nr:heterokaryon incompatibility protein-domain-containing protein [Lophiotrema nucula]